VRILVTGGAGFVDAEWWRPQKETTGEMCAAAIG
jgi:hypothetical protein